MTISEGILRSSSTFLEETGQLSTVPEALSTANILESSPEFLAETGQDLPTSNLDSQSISTPTNNGFLTSGYIVVNPLNADMQKVPLSQIGLEEAREIRPSIRKHPDWRSFYIQMVDRNFDSVGIVLSSGVLISSLKLTPTPNSLTINSAKIINRYNTMTRWVEEHWGDEIDTITLAGSTYSFLAHNLANVPEVGVTNKYRRGTKAYEIMREMQKIFHYNGIIFQDSKTYEGTGNLFEGNLGVFGSNLTATDRFLSDPTNQFFINRHPRRGLAKERLYINLYFDYLSATGYFESFDLMQDENDPFKLTYSISFKAERIKWIQGNKATSSTSLLIPPGTDTGATQTPNKKDPEVPRDVMGFTELASAEEVGFNADVGV